MTRRRRRQRASRSRSGIIAVITVGVATGVIIFGLFTLVGGGDDEASPEEVQQVLQVTPDDHTLGDSRAPVTLVEYADFQ
jgi:protein-disulfide isomerase